MRGESRQQELHPNPENPSVRRAHFASRCVSQTLYRCTIANKIRAITNPRNLFNSLLSRKWHIVLQDDDTTIFFDGDKQVVQLKEFPCGSTREITMPDGTRWYRNSSADRLRCDADGAHPKNGYGEIFVDLEACSVDSGALYGCACINVVGHDYCVIEVDW